MRKILVLRGGALGDFIVTLPALSALRRRWPDARIELAGNAAAADLARARSLLDAVHSQHEARWAALYSASPLPAEFATWLGEFDLVINFWPDPDRELGRHFPIRDGQQFLSAPAMPTRSPAAAHYCEPLRAVGIEICEHFFRLERQAASPDLRNGIYVHPGSGSPRKSWSKPNWLRLIPILPPPVSLILGDAEQTTWNDATLSQLRHHSSEKAASRLARGPGPAEWASPAAPLALRNAPLESLVAHLSRCRLFLGHDSGISHLAAACGAKCVLLFGPTEPAMWAPPAPSVQVLRRDPDLDSISVADVQAAVAAALADQT